MAASVALPGWAAAEIHAALNEPALSEAPRAALERVGRALGAAAGSGPDDDPWLGAQRREARAEGRAEGRAEIVRSILRNRGLAVSERLAARIAGEDPTVLAAEALACRDEADLWPAWKRGGDPDRWRQRLDYRSSVTAPPTPAASPPGLAGMAFRLTPRFRRIWT